jgi:hypothetical protein
MDSSSLVHEMTRLRNELRAKDKEISDRMSEIRSMESTLSAKDTALEEVEDRLTTTRDKLLELETETASVKKALSDARSDRDRLKAELYEAEREADRLNRALAANAERSTTAVNGATDDIGRIQAALASARRDKNELEGEQKRFLQKIAERDAELADFMTKHDALKEELKISKKEAHNTLATIKKQLEAKDRELADLTRLQAFKEAEASDHAAEAARVTTELNNTNEYLAGVMIELSTAQESLKHSKTEIGDLKDRLTRLSSARRSSAGGDGGNLIPVSRHLAELKAAQNEAARLRTQLEQAEASVANARAQRDRLFAKVDSLAAGVKVPLSPTGSMARGGDPSSPHSIAAGDLGDMIGSPTVLVAELRSQMVDLRKELIESQGAAAALAEQGDTAWRQSVEARLDAAKLRRKLFETLGEEAYFEEFGEGEPPVVDASLEEELIAAQKAEVQRAQRSAEELAGAKTDADRLRQKLTDATLQLEEAAAATPAVAAAAAAEAGQHSEQLQKQLAAAINEVAGLQEQNAALKEHIATIIEEEDDDDDDNYDEEEEEDNMYQTTSGQMSAAAYAKQERHRNFMRNWQGEGMPWYDAATPADPYEAAGMTPHSLASLLEKILALRESRKKGSKGKKGDAEDEALHKEATNMLRGELARLGREMISKVDEADRLKEEIGELQTSRLSAEAVAARLDEMNELSARVASLKMEMARRQQMYARREGELLNEIEKLKSGGKKGAGKMLKKKFSAAAKGMQKGIESAGAAVENAVLAAQERVTKSGAKDTTTPGGGGSQTSSVTSARTARRSAPPASGTPQSKTTTAAASPASGSDNTTTSTTKIGGMSSFKALSQKLNFGKKDNANKGSGAPTDTLSP